MIDATTLTTYTAIVAGFAFMPGPASLLTVARATTSGTRVGLATGAGIAAGDVVHTMMAVIGISAVLATSAIVFSIVKYLGAAYLLYLGLQVLFAGEPAGSRPLSPGRITARRAFAQAVVVEVLNPKTALFFLAFLPQFVHPGNGSVVMQLATLGVVFVFFGLVSTAIFAMSAARIGRVFQGHPTVQKWQGKFVGGVFCALGVRLAFQDR